MSGERGAPRAVLWDYYIIYAVFSSCVNGSNVNILQIVPHRASALSFIPSADGKPSADTAVRRWRRLYALGGRGGVAAFDGRECRRLAAETKGDRTPMVSCPLLTPQTFLCADTSEMCSETGGIRGHDSGRLSAYGTLYCPEFTLRKPPRITVRGQTVQSASAVAAKSSASIKGVLLEQQTPLWASRI